MKPRFIIKLLIAVTAWSASVAIASLQSKL